MDLMDFGGAANQDLTIPQNLDLTDRIQIGPSIPEQYHYHFRQWCNANAVTMDGTITSLIGLLIEGKINNAKVAKRAADVDMERVRQRRKKRRQV